MGEIIFSGRAKSLKPKLKQAFLEWAEYAGNLYGTPRETVEEWINLGQTVILEIELVGARQVAKTFPDALRVFVAPPSMEVLEQRLRGRVKIQKMRSPSA
jgi:guanylate kinase